MEDKQHGQPEPLTLYHAVVFVTVAGLTVL